MLYAATETFRETSLAAELPIREESSSNHGHIVAVAHRVES